MYLASRQVPVHGRCRFGHTLQTPTFAPDGPRDLSLFASRNQICRLWPKPVKCDMVVHANDTIVVSEVHVEWVAAHRDRRMYPRFCRRRLNCRFDTILCRITNQISTDHTAVPSRLVGPGSRLRLSSHPPLPDKSQD